jgi:hypothetical protein
MTKTELKGENKRKNTVQIFDIKTIYPHHFNKKQASCARIESAIALFISSQHQTKPHSAYFFRNECGFL